MSASMDVGSHQDGEHTTESCADSHEPLPVIVFSHGLKSMRSIYSGICCDLASHGYVVAAVEHRYVYTVEYGEHSAAYKGHTTGPRETFIIRGVL